MKVSNSSSGRAASGERASGRASLSCVQLCDVAVRDVTGSLLGALGRTLALYGLPGS